MFTRSLTTTATNAISGPSPPLEPNVRPILQSLLLAHTFLILLAPLLFSLLYYSTPHSRSQPIFVLNILAIVMAFVMGVISDIAGIRIVLSPQEMLPPMFFFADGIIGIFGSMLVDVILLIRLISVFPLSRVGPRRFVLIMSSPIILKIVRLVNVIIFIVVLTDVANHSNNPITAITDYFNLPFLKVEWIIQVVDNGYVSIMFLRTIHGRGVTSEHPTGGGTVVRSRLVSRLRWLFRIALSNFVIPTIFSIVQLIIAFRDVGASYVGDVVYTNNMLSVYGVVFASVWAGTESRRKLKEAKESSNQETINRNRSTRDLPSTPGLGTWKATPRSPSFVLEITAATVHPESPGLDGTLGGPKRGTPSSDPELWFLDVVDSGIDLESCHEIALVPLAKRSSQSPAPPASPARSLVGMNVSSS